MDRVNRVVYVDTLNSQADVCNIFSSCGKIRGLYQWTSEREKVHYFVEFRQLESVTRARVLKLPQDTHVHSLACIPQLIDRFCALAESGGDPLSDFLPPVRRKHSRFGSQPVSNCKMPTFSAAFEEPDFVISTRRRRDSDKENSQFSLPTSLTTPVPISFSTPVNLPCQTPSHVAVSTRLVLSLCDESIAYDLDSLEDDPKGIISLLSLASSGRDKWMVVGGHYRRKGNVKAAISVVTTMIEVMTRAGVPEGDLKPAFLMLSSCQTDLAKRARDPAGANTETSLNHFQQSQQWLRKVYGSDLPPPAQDAVASVSKDKTVAGISSSSQANDQHSSSGPHPNLPPHPNLRPISAPSSATTSLPPPPSTSGRICILEREIQSLRDRNSTQQTVLLESKSLKHKLEDELICEKSARRKVEKKNDQLESELQISRRMEAFALDQIKREVENRRKAEEREKELMDRIEEMEREMKTEANVGKVVLFEDLATMFQKAAQGEGLLLSGRSADEGISRDA